MKTIPAKIKNMELKLIVAICTLAILSLYRFWNVINNEIKGSQYNVPVFNKLNINCMLPDSDTLIRNGKTLIDNIIVVMMLNLDILFLHREI